MRNPQMTTVARSLRALVEEIKAERGDVEDYLIVDDVLERLPRYATELESADQATTVTRPQSARSGGDPR